MGWLQTQGSTRFYQSLGMSSLFQHFPPIGRRQFVYQHLERAVGPSKAHFVGTIPVPGSGAILSIFPGANGATASMVARGLSSSEIASRLAASLRRPVIDKTGLPGKYDFVLEYTPDLSGIPLPAGFTTHDDNHATDPGTNIASAVEKQLGLKLTSTKGKLDVIVVDRAEKTPTQN